MLNMSRELLEMTAIHMKRSVEKLMLMFTVDIEDRVTRNEAWCRSHGDEFELR